MTKLTLKQKVRCPWCKNLFIPRSPNYKYCGACYKERRRHEYYERKEKYPWEFVWHGIKARCNKRSCPSFNQYGGRGIKCLMTKDEVKTLWFRDKAHKLNLPSIDRIDPNGHYVFGNCRFIELSENVRRARTGSKRSGNPIKQLTPDGKIVKYWDKVKDAAAFHNTCHANISRCLKRPDRVAVGFKWAYITKEDNYGKIVTF